MKCIAKAVLFGFTGFVACHRTDPELVRRESANVPADNTRKNVRDGLGETVTPLDQSESEADRAVTQQIRQELMKTDLSMNAKNIKIVTSHGLVTLRGPVESQKEKEQIMALAGRVTKPANVSDQLEVALK